MNDVARVSNLQRVGYLSRDREGFIHRQCAAPMQSIAQTAAFEKRHRNEGPIVLGKAVVIDRHDVGVRQACCGACFPFEALAKMRVRIEAFVDDLDGHQTA